LLKKCKQKYTEMIQISICWILKLQSSEADVVQSLVVDAVSLVGVLNKLMNRKSCVVGLNDRVRDLKDRKMKPSKKLKGTLGDGTTEKEDIMRSGYSSRIFEMSKVPIPEPVPPPSE